MSESSTRQAFVPTLTSLFTIASAAFYLYAEADRSDTWTTAAAAGGEYPTDTTVWRSFGQIVDTFNPNMWNLAFTGLIMSSVWLGILVFRMTFKEHGTESTDRILQSLWFAIEPVVSAASIVLVGLPVLVGGGLNSVESLTYLLVLLVMLEFAVGGRYAITVFGNLLIGIVSFSALVCVYVTVVLPFNKNELASPNIGELYHVSAALFLLAHTLRAFFLILFASVKNGSGIIQTPDAGTDHEELGDMYSRKLPIAIYWTVLFVATIGVYLAYFVSASNRDAKMGGVDTWWPRATFIGFFRDSAIDGPMEIGGFAWLGFISAYFAGASVVFLKISMFNGIVLSTAAQWFIFFAVAGQSFLYAGIVALCGTIDVTEIVLGSLLFFLAMNIISSGRTSAYAHLSGVDGGGLAKMVDDTVVQIVHWTAWAIPALSVVVLLVFPLHKYYTHSPTDGGKDQAVIWLFFLVVIFNTIVVHGGIVVSMMRCAGAAVGSSAAFGKRFGMGTIGALIVFTIVIVISFAGTSYVTKPEALAMIPVNDTYVDWLNVTFGTPV